MIIVKLMGGLGNQMFQYALGRRLAYERGTSLKLDLTWFQTQTLRSYKLDSLKVHGEIASPFEIDEIKRADWVGLKGRVYQAIQRRLPYFRRRVVVEKAPYFDPCVVKYPGPNTYLMGYWQSEKYFAPIALLLREELKLKEPFSPDFDFWREKISKVQSSSLHVRRGDYANVPYTNQVHGTCSLDYYHEAVKYIRQQIPEAIIFVFSDNIDWSRENLGSFSGMEFVKLSCTNRDQEELWLMSMCHHHIIANSSYSWWGAWLGNNLDKIVIAPQKWFNDITKNPLDLIPENWIRI